MTLKEWKQEFPLMNWELFTETSPTDGDDYLDRELSFDAPDGLRDGGYKFDCFVRRDGKPKMFRGIIIKNGKFDPFATAWSIYSAVISSYYEEPVQRGCQVNHKFIEEIKWVGTHFEVGLGS